MGGWSGRKYAGEFGDTKWMTINPNPGFLLYFSFFCERAKGMGRAGERGSRVEQGEVFAGEWKKLFSYVALQIILIHIALHFHQDIP